MTDSALLLRASTARSRSMLSRFSVKQVIYALIALTLSFVFLLPIIWMTFASFRTIPDLSTYPPTLTPRSWTLDNYTQVFKELPFLRLYRNTFLYAGTVTVSSLVLDSMAAYALARLRFRGSSAVFVIIIILLMLPFQVTLVPLYQLMHSLGLINTLPGLIIPRSLMRSASSSCGSFFLGFPMTLRMLPVSMERRSGGSSGRSSRRSPNRRFSHSVSSISKATGTI